MFLFGKSINEWVKIYNSDPKAKLIDVREADEFQEGHIPGAINIPLSRIETISLDFDTPLYLYCLRGSRSMRAMAILKRMGYRKVVSAGGILQYTGETENSK